MSRISDVQQRAATAARAEVAEQAAAAEAEYWRLLDCGCPAGVVQDDDHQEGCEQITADLCERTWKSDQPTRTEDSYRQHRCGWVAAGHLPGECWCRYCGESTAERTGGAR